MDVVAQSSKQGFLYVFDRVTGKPLWPIEERPVPKSLMPGEQAWPTQPFPTAPPPFARQKITADDVNPYILTPEERAGMEGQNCQHAERRTLHSARNDGDDLAARSARRIELGQRRRQSHQRPAVPEYAGLADDLQIESRRSTWETHDGVRVRKALYEARCQACHGVNGVRSGSGPPPLAAIGKRLAFDSFRI